MSTTQKSAAGASWQFCLDCYQNKSKRQGNLEGNFICPPQKEDIKMVFSRVIRIQSTADSHIRTKSAHVPSIAMLQDQSWMHTLFLRRWERDTQKKPPQRKQTQKKTNKAPHSSGKITVPQEISGPVHCSLMHFPSNGYCYCVRLQMQNHTGNCACHI